MSEPRPLQLYQKFIGPSTTLLVEKMGWRGGDRSLPKQYTGHVNWQKKRTGHWDPVCWNNWDIVIPNHFPFGGVQNRLRSLIADTIGERAELGAAIVEIRSTFDLLRTQVMRLVRAASLLKRGLFRSFLDYINTKPKKRHKRLYRTAPKQAGKLWLEYWFAIAPTVSDIQTTVQALTTPSYGTGWLRYDVKTRGMHGSCKLPPSSSSPAVDVVGKVKGRAGGRYRVANENVVLAQRLGLLNPVEVLYVVTPWSWLLDWFVNLGEWLSQSTTFAGIEFEKDSCYYTVHGEFTGTITWIFDGWVYYSGDTGGYYMTRKIGVPTVTLRLADFSLSITRAATAVSLLVQQLSDFSNPRR